MDAREMRVMLVKESLGRVYARAVSTLVGSGFSEAEADRMCHDALDGLRMELALRGRMRQECVIREPEE